MRTETEEALFTQNQTIVELGDKFRELLEASQGLSNYFKTSTPDGEWAHIFASIPALQQFMETVDKLAE